MNNVDGGDVTQSLLVELENELDRVSGADLPDHMYHKVRRLIARYIMELCGCHEEPIPSLPDVIKSVLECVEVTPRRNAANLVLRMAGTPGALPEDDSTQLRRIVIQLIDKALPDLVKRLNLDGASQTFEKYELVREFHPRICEQLSVLSKMPADAPHILASQKEVMRAVGNDKAAAYLNQYDLKRVKTSVAHIYAALREITEISDSSFGEKVINLGNFVKEELVWANSFVTFLNRHYYSKFLGSVTSALKQVELEAKDRFVCEIKSKRTGKDVAEKHYPLHDVGRLTCVSVMLVNTGPGVALEVVAEISSTSEDVQFDSRIEIGDIAPGDYPLSFEIMASKASVQVALTVMLTWLEIGKPESKSYIFDLTLVGQNPSVDWKKLSNYQPYSTEVAEGEEFVGRSSKVTAISNRFLMARMGSSFITGQKRVGKTSLARAVEGKVRDAGRDYESLYLEYGQYSRMDPVDTVDALGQELAEFMLGILPANTAPPKDLNFRGSLAPLNKLADLLVKEIPEKRFIFILDEFDEIHPEMYRFGALAETFFSNLRTLSAKKNVAFLLVGGEKMPFVMSAQGDQLNKFISEGLDYFVRGDEWEDYKELVSRPVRNELNWADTAIQRVFDITNGHPYYTKLLCANIFANSVQEHDSEITESDVKHSAKRLVAELDGNAFAHLWKDGICEDRERAEVLELHRRRVLTACARVIRDKLPLTVENVLASKSSLRISTAEVISVLNDFMRRGILIQNRSGKQYDFSVPLFERWLVEVGIARLMSDTLSEEYESIAQRTEEQARISSSELIGLTDKWPLYRGSKIGTEEVRAWLEQAPLNTEQRLLFKLLQNLRFVSKPEIREKLVQAHSMLLEYLPEFVQEKRSDRRKDMLITWVDGPGKSGATYAALYAEDNKISTKCLAASSDFSNALNDYERNNGASVAAVVIVDDFIGTGNSLSKNITNFVENNIQILKKSGVRILVVAVTATQKGAQNVRDQMAKLEIEGELYICEPLSERYLAFGEGLGFWESAEEKGRAKELCQRLGTRVHRTNPLGYGNQGLLIVFPETCPNNTLPILHCDASGVDHWRSIFVRPKN